MRPLPHLPEPPGGVRRVLLVDDHPVFRFGVAQLLERETDLRVAAEAETAAHALEAMRGTHPDAALIDISLNGTNGIELIKLLRAEAPRLAILVLSMHDESVYALRALRAGAGGYVMKSEAASAVVPALRRVLGGEIYLSPGLAERLVIKAVQSLDAGLGSPVDELSDRELEVLQLLGKGFGTREIATELHLSIKTIETHRAHAREKLGLKDGGEVVRFAIDWVGQAELTSG